MSSQIIFVPQEMYEMAADLERWADELRAVGDDVDIALDRFRRSSTELVPELPAHGDAIGMAADPMTALGQNVALVGAAAEQTDRAGTKDVRDVVLNIAAGIRLADVAVTVPAAVQRLVTASVHALAAMGYGLKLWHLRWQFGRRPMPDMAKVRARTPGGASLSHAEARLRQVATYREVKGLRRRLVRSLDDARWALRSHRPVTGLGGHVRTFLNTTPAGRTLTVGSRALGGAGALLSAADAVAAFQEQDYERTATSGLLAGGGALMLFPNPVTAGIGATVVVGVTIYDNWDTISGWADDAWDGITGTGASVVEGAGKLLSRLF